MGGFLTEGVIVAIVTSLVTGVATIVSVIMSSRLTVYRIEQLEKKVEKHNNFADRLTIVEQSAKSAHKRMDGARHE